MNDTLIEQNLQQYAEEMAPGKPHGAEQGPMNQLGLYRAIQTVLRQEGPAFIQAMDYVLKVFHEHRDGAFNERYVFRYMENVKLGKIERKVFERLISLFVTTANPATRAQTIRQVDLAAVVKGIPDGNVQQRLYEYYGVAA